MDKLPKKPAERTEYLSEDGLRQINKELDILKSTKRKEIADRLEYAKSLGDLSENSEYQDAKEAQVENEMRIAELEDVLLRSVVVEKTDDDSSVSMGSEVVLRREGEKNDLRVVLAGAGEADLSASKISYESPLGKALLGHKKSDKITVLTPKGETKYKILDII
ncbi:MAG: transcription elongation factor GreA [Candidatus Niyogibacteria bacterium]|nr:transcription elongation factor GreA [Candidatus Niyogibacteria bacterium]